PIVREAVEMNLRSLVTSALGAKLAVTNALNIATERVRGSNIIRIYNAYPPLPGFPPLRHNTPWTP
ncbi:hypothetical protein BaRGS_00007948, partial [Batillaria attramentaria]